MADAHTSRKDLLEHGEAHDENLDELTDDKVRYPDPDDPTKTLEREPEPPAKDGTPVFHEPSGTDEPSGDFLRPV